MEKRNKATEEEKKLFLKRRKSIDFYSGLQLLLFIIVLTTCVNAQPPFQESVSIIGIQIESPIIEFHKVNQQFEFHIHAHNTSSGLLLRNDTTDCIIHVYRQSDGEHIIEENMSWNGNNVDFEFEVNKENLTELGQYAALFYCEVPGEIGGFFEHSFVLTANGNSNTRFPNEFVIIFIAIVLLAIGLVRENLRMFKHLGSILIMIMGVLTVYPGYAFINYTNLLGRGLGFILIGLGFYFLIEDSFSRNKQEDNFDSQSKDD